MAKLGKRLAGLLGSETVDKLKNIGTDAIGEVIGSLTGADVDSKDKSESAPPPSGKRFDDPAPEQASVEAEVTPGKVAEPAASSVADKVIELNRLRESGVLSDAEFAELKSELLGS
jgi:hypothetical protein